MVKYSDKVVANFVKTGDSPMEQNPCNIVKK